MIASDVEGAGINWGQADQKMLRQSAAGGNGKICRGGPIPGRFHGPKVEAVMQFTKATGNRGVICQLEDIEKAIAGKAGTEIIK